MTANSFYQKYYAHALLACAFTPISPLLVLSAAYLESGKGESKLALNDNNFFGRKAVGSEAGRVYKTKEQKTNGDIYYIDAKFKTFLNPVDSFKGYVKNITNDHYKAHGVTSTNDPEKQAIAVHAAGYATAKNYSAVLIQLIHQFGAMQPKLSSIAPFLLAVPFALPFTTATVLTLIFVAYVLYKSGRLRVPAYLHRYL